MNEVGDDAARDNCQPSLSVPANWKFSQASFKSLSTSEDAMPLKIKARYNLIVLYLRHKSES